MAISYWVMAEDGGGLPVPPPPTGVQASDGSYADRVHIIWAVTPGVTYYEVYRAVCAGGNKTNLGPASGTTFDDFTAAPGVTCYYWVKACNTSGSSGFSAYDAGFFPGQPPDEYVYLPPFQPNRLPSIFALFLQYGMIST